ncbi:MBL fold metallo-hydrolase [Priestia megaterium]|uniref:MBL fold metallo-hydrolase n=1 Tax=Priestia megaterium TaxID=1404 RepID=UPI00189042D7|nr:MBL fold metallo-hydrolase [Priestia megaterium]
MTLFTAFSTQGDAFLVERRDFTLLVDGGEDPDFGKNFMDHIRNRRLSKGLKKRIPNYGKREYKIDLLVCTHEDSDHVNGIISLLEQDYISVLCVWLPVLWKEILCLILDNNVGCYALIEFIKAKIRNQKNNYPKDQETLDELEKELEKMGDFDIEKSLNQLKQISTSYNNLISFLCQNKINSSKDFTSLFLNRNKDIMELISKVVHIAALAKLGKGAKVEWLTYNPKTSYTPVKSSSVTCLSHNIIAKGSTSTLVGHRRGHKINDESIVCLSKGKGTIEPDILFCADSKLSDIDIGFIKSLNKNCLITVPHHGAYSNDDTLDKLIKNSNRSIWVRGDSTRIKMGNKFLSLSRNARMLNKKRVFCTECRKYKRTGRSYSSHGSQILVLKYIYNSKKRRGKWVTKNKCCQCEMNL